MIRWFLLALVISGCAHQLPDAAPGGKLIFAAGDVRAHRGNPIALQANDLVYEQNLVETDKRSRAQFLISDGTMLALRPQTRLFVEAFSSTNQSGHVLDLIQGGLHSISRGNGRNRIKTPAGTVEIGNAHYNLIWCDDNCSRTGAPEVMNGLYLGISEGTMSISNNMGKHELRAGQYLYLPDRNSPPRYLDAQPAALIDTDRTMEFANEKAAREVNEILQELGGPLPTASTRPR